MNRPELTTDYATRPEPLFASLVEAAEVLRVSKRTVERMVADGTIPTRRLRRRRVISWRVLEGMAEAE